MKKPYVYVFLLWMILTAININKAYHIDDTFHLEAAEYIAQNPLTPMSGNINWGDDPTPMYKHNQPPLFFYLIAFYQSIFGTSEIPNHLLLSVFTLLALLYFIKLAKLLEVKSLLPITTVFAFCPAFIVNQNLMTDVPILVISLATMYYLLKGQKSDRILDYLFAAILLSIGLLIKYSLLPILGVIFVTILASKRPKNIIVLLIPIVVLIGWSFFNIMEFDEIHILTRRKNRFSVIRIISFVCTLGAIGTFTALYIYKYVPKKITKIILILFYVLFTIAIPLVYHKVIDESYFNKLVSYLFPINGFILLLSICYQAFQNYFNNKLAYFRTPKFVLFTYIVGVSSFVAIFAPFSATRHILLLIPIILLYAHKIFDSGPDILKKLIISSSIVLGIIIGISDWQYANFYRKNAENPAIPKSNVWTLGHWGWQWYAKKAGMKFYSKNKEYNLREGDIIVFPIDISKQVLSEEIVLDTLDYIIDEPSITSFLSVKNFASMYNSSIKKPAWTLSNAPIDTILICKVQHELDIQDVVNRINSNKEWFEGLKQKSEQSNLPLDTIVIKEAKKLIAEKRRL